MNLRVKTKNHTTRVSHKIDLKAVWSRNGQAASVRVKLNLTWHWRQQELFPLPHPSQRQPQRELEKSMISITLVEICEIRMNFEEFFKMSKRQLDVSHGFEEENCRRFSNQMCHSHCFVNLVKTSRKNLPCHTTFSISYLILNLL